MHAAGAQRPERTAMAVLAAFGFQPLAAKAHEIAKAARVAIQRRGEKG